MRTVILWLITRQKWCNVQPKHADGDVPGKPEYLGQIDVKDTEAAIAYYNEQIRFDEVENAVIIDRNGNMYYSIGDANSVSLEGVELSGATITHNHPASNGILSFGRDDFMLLRGEPEIHQLIAVNERYTYSVYALKRLDDVIYSTYYHKAMEEADIFDPDLDIQHDVFKILDREGYVKYVREAINTRTE